MAKAKKRPSYHISWIPSFWTYYYGLTIVAFFFGDRAGQFYIETEPSLTQNRRYSGNCGHYLPLVRCMEEVLPGDQNQMNTCIYYRGYWVRIKIPVRCCGEGGLDQNMLEALGTCFFEPRVTVLEPLLAKTVSNGI